MDEVLIIILSVGYNRSSRVNNNFIQANHLTDISVLIATLSNSYYSNYRISGN